MSKSVRGFGQISSVAEALALIVRHARLAPMIARLSRGVFRIDRWGCIGCKADAVRVEEAGSTLVDEVSYSTRPSEVQCHRCSANR